MRIALAKRPDVIAGEAGATLRAALRAVSMGHMAQARLELVLERGLRFDSPLLTPAEELDC